MRAIKGELNRPEIFSDLVKTAIIVEDESGDKVYEVVHRPTGETYALKEFYGPYNSIDYAEIGCEIEVLNKLDHPNLVKCHEVFYVEGRLYVLLENVRDLTGFHIKSEFALAGFARQILLGLEYLHKNQTSHGDIKPSNIFINHTGQVKVLYTGKVLSKLTPVLWTRALGVHDEFSWDIWSVGFCILKFCKGLTWFNRYFKFGDIGSEEFPSSSRDEGAVVHKPSVELWRFLSCCMRTERDGAKRWTVEQLIRHPFFDQLPARLLQEKGKFSVLHLPFSPASSPEGGFLIEHAFLSPASSSEREFSVEHASLSLSAAVSSTVITSHEGEEQNSPRKKKAKISTKDEDSIHDLEMSKDPTQRSPPPHLKRCIEHCNLFLPDCEFEKDKLVQMWIAEDCIELDVTKRMEDIANLFFDVLVDEEIIIPSKFDNAFRRMKYRVNASKASTWLLKGGNYVRIDAGSSDEICGVVLHLTWQCKSLDQTSIDALKNFEQLRTLVVLEDCSALIKQLPNNIFSGLKLLRTLDLSRTHISELPGSVGLLESLRYLDVSETPIKRLPESVDRLFYLQMLKLKGCFGLSALPKGLGRLINLRHLDLDIVSQLEFMPRGMGNLIKLQTLQTFLVGKNDRCGIGELKNMNEITGSFCISMLENVSNAEEAKEAALGDKKHIDKLELRWHDHVDEDPHNTAEILEYLRPHFQLKELQLTFYSGSKLPSWISNPSFTDLANITLYKCINCDILSSIGELPSLKVLYIVGMNNVKKINSLFCRNQGAQGFNAFPRLEKLTLDTMLNLEEWTGTEDGDFPHLRHVSITYCPKLYVLPSLSHLCSLQHLEISHCMQLKSLPEGLLPGSLESLIIRGCPEINERCVKDEGPDWLKISSVKNIWIDFGKVYLD